jgi:hypothetical protein
VIFYPFECSSALLAGADCSIVRLRCRTLTYDLQRVTGEKLCQGT